MTERVRFTQEAYDVLQYAPHFQEYDRLEIEKYERYERDQARREAQRQKELAESEHGQSFKFYEID